MLPFFFSHHADLSSSRMIPQQHLRPYQPPTEKISAKRQSGLNKKGRFQSFGEERIRHGTGLHSVAVLVAQNNKHRSNDAYTYFATRRLTFFFFLGARVYIPDPLHRIDKQPDQFMLVPQVSWDIFQHTHVHYWGKGVRKMDGKVTKCTFRICRCWHFYEIVLLQQEITDV